MDWNSSEDNAHINILDLIYSGTAWGGGAAVRVTMTKYIQINMPDNY